MCTLGVFYCKTRVLIFKMIFPEVLKFSVRSFHLVNCVCRNRINQRFRDVLRISSLQTSFFVWLNIKNIFYLCFWGVSQPTFRFCEEVAKTHRAQHNSCSCHMIYYYESIQRKVSREKSAWDEICEAQVSENPLSGATWIMLILVSVIACIERFGPEKLRILSSALHNPGCGGHA